MSSEASTADVAQSPASDAEAAAAEIVNMCTTPGCGKPASMSCPNCLKLGILTSYFCDQDCFKAYWSQHKSLHKLVKKARDEKDPTFMPTEFKGFTFTGSNPFRDRNFEINICVLRFRNRCP